MRYDDKLTANDEVPLNAFKTWINDKALKLYQSCWKLISDMSPDDPVKTKQLKFCEWVEKDIHGFYEKLGAR